MRRQHTFEQKISESGFPHVSGLSFLCDVNTLFDFLRIPCFFVPSGLGFLDEVLSVLVAFVLIYPGPSDGRLLTYGGVVGWLVGGSV